MVGAMSDYPSHLRDKVASGVFLPPSHCACCLAARGSCTSPSSDKLAYTVTPSGSDAGLAGRVADLVLDALRPRFDVFEARAAQSEVRMAHLTGLMRQQAYSPDDAMGVLSIDDPTAITMHRTRLL